MQLIHTILKTQQQLHDDHAGLVAVYPNAFSPKQLHEHPAFQYSFEVVDGNDSVVVQIELTDIGDTDGACIFDTAISVDNNDWASLHQQHQAIGLALQEFYAKGYDKAHGILIGA